MKKIPTMFERDWNGDRSRVLPVPAESCAWVFAGEGVPTIKLNGTCTMVRDGALLKRREVKPGQLIPEGFEASERDGDSWFGWVPVGPGAVDRWARLALEDTGTECLRRTGAGLPDGTYELMGPAINKNPDGHARHVLVRHGSVVPPADDPPPREYEALARWLEERDVEGLVFHHPDGRMAKIKKRDFGLPRVPE